MIPAQARIDRPVAEPDRIFDVGRLFEIRTVTEKCKRKRAGI